MMQQVKLYYKIGYSKLIALNVSPNTVQYKHLVMHVTRYLGLCAF